MFVLCGKIKFKLLLAIGYYFSYFLLVNKLYELNVFKFFNVFQTRPEK